MLLAVPSQCLGPESGLDEITLCDFPPIPLQFCTLHLPFLETALKSALECVRVLFHVFFTGFPCEEADLCTSSGANDTMSRVCDC